MDTTEHSHTLVKINSLKIIEKMAKEKNQNKLIDDMFMAP